MTIQTTDPVVSYGGDGSSVSFPIPFQFFGANELLVVRRTNATGVETTLVLNADYTVSGGNGGTGTLTTTVPLAVGQTIAIARKTSRAQNTAYPEGDPFPAEAHERALDRAYAIAQEIDRAQLQSLRLRPTDPSTLALLPVAADRASRYLGFDASGAPVMLSQAPGGTTFLQAGAGAVTRLVEARLQDEISVRDYGAAGDGTNNDTSAIQAALNHASATGKVVWFPHGTYRVTATLTAAHGIGGIRMDGELLFDSTANIPALEIGSPSPDRILAKAFCGLAVRRNTQSDWSSEGSIGIVLRNLDGCLVEVARVEGFTIGVRTLGDGAGAAGFKDTSLFLGLLANNCIGLDVRTAGTGAWNNGVRYFGGHFSVSSATNPSIGTIGVRLSSEPGAYNLHNAHTFYSPSFALAAAARPFAYPFVNETDGRGLYAYGVRMEDTSKAIARHTGAARDCVYQPLYAGTHAYTVDVEYAATATRAGAIVDTMEGASHRVFSRPVSVIDNVRARAIRSSVGEAGFEGLVVVTNALPSSFSNANIEGASNAGWTLGADSVTILTEGRGLAFPVRLQGCRDFVLALSGDDGLRVIVRLFDAAGNLLDNTSHRVLSSLHSFTWNATAGWWQSDTGLSDAALNRLIHLRLEGPNAASAQIGIARIGTDQVIRSMALYCDHRFQPQIAIAPGLPGSAMRTFTTTYDPPLLNAGATTTQPFTVSGVRPTDIITVSHSAPNAGIFMLGRYSAPNTVAVMAWNRSSISIDLDAGELNIMITKPRA